MVSGATVAVYAFLEVMRYAKRRIPLPPLVGDTPMAFSTAVCLLILSLAIFWMGWVIKDLRYNLRYLKRLSAFSPTDAMPLIAAIITAAALVMTAIIGLFKN